jgi:hypothetical protein
MLLCLLRYDLASCFLNGVRCLGLTCMLLACCGGSSEGAAIRVCKDLSLNT